ncbi:MAG TPA: ABC transporter [Firmicutes bacterium]|nr:ABC transporter [Bacillota bacterium]HAW99865.1 ABC transporter [Bacillota bacterium]
MENNIIEIENLSKSFKDVKAVSDLSFSVKKGELFAFLGVNGAGKSTTISIICNQLKKDSGKIVIDGVDIDKNSESINSKLGVVFQASVLDGFLTVYDNLKNRAALYGIYGKEFEKRLDELSDILNFKDLLKRSVKKLSGGQRRKIDIARALFHHPKILILDEPTTGLDPQTRKNIWNVINKLRKEEQITVLLTTHYMEEAADADYVVIIDSGKKVASGTPLELKNKYTGDFITLYNVKEEDVIKLGFPYEVIRDAYRIAIPDTKTASNLIIEHQDIFNDFEITKGKMDDVFLQVTGKKLGDNK